MKKNTNAIRTSNTQTDPLAAQGAFDQAMLSVMDELPISVKHGLAAGWESENTDGNPSLQVDVCLECFDELRSESERYHPVIALSASRLLCDIEFFGTAPQEVARVAVARALAQSYTHAWGAAESNADEQDVILRQMIITWGFLPDELEMWFAAKKATPGQALEMYYACRYQHFTLPPPAGEDLLAIAAILDEKGRADLAGELRLRQAGTN